MVGSGGKLEKQNYCMIFHQTDLRDMIINFSINHILHTIQHIKFCGVFF